MDRKVIYKQIASTQTAAKKKIRGLIAESKLKQNLLELENNELYSILKILLPLHSKWLTIKPKLNKLWIDLDKENKNRCIHYSTKDNEEGTLSWSKLFGTQKSQYNHDLDGALRAAVAEQTLTFKNNSAKVCALCNCNDTLMEYHVDHIIHMTKLQEDFFNTYNYKKPTEFNSNSEHYHIFKPEDYELELSWVNYHYNNAILRLLCKPCNLQRKKYKPYE